MIKEIYFCKNVKKLKVGSNHLNGHLRLNCYVRVRTHFVVVGQICSSLTRTGKERIQELLVGGYALAFKLKTNKLAMIRLKPNLEVGCLLSIC